MTRDVGTFPLRDLCPFFVDHTVFIQLVFVDYRESIKKEEYLCFPEHYSACYSFFYDIVNRGEQLCVSLVCFSSCYMFRIFISVFVNYLNNFQCKHQLVARLAVSLGTCVDMKVSDEQLAELLAKL